MHGCVEVVNSVRVVVVDRFKSRCSALLGRPTVLTCDSSSWRYICSVSCC